MQWGMVTCDSVCIKHLDLGLMTAPYKLWFVLLRVVLAILHLTLVCSKLYRLILGTWIGTIDDAVTALVRGITKQRMACNHE